VSGSEAATPVVRLANLRKSFRGHLGIGRTVAVEHVDLQIDAGQVIGLLGPNGAGKTTTLKMMLGLLRPDHGEVRLFGEPPSAPSARARLGYLPENPYFYDYLKAGEFLDFYGRLQGIPKEERRTIVRDTIRRVGLEGCEATALRKFSKGMIQRLGLAQAIQHDPDLVILDEPMSGLDPIGSHILQDAELICDGVAILDKGRLRAVGRLNEMMSETVRWFEVSFRGQLPDGNDLERLSSEGEDHLLRVADIASLARVLDSLQRSGGQVLSIWPRKDTLEDLFLREVGHPAAGEARR
jgi:ABC-2 type transport system ATP-binding protein